MNPYTIHFQDTGLPKGLVSKVHKGAGTVTAECWVTAIQNAGSTSTTLTFGSDAHLDVMQLPAASAIALPYPIHCSAFTTAETNVSVVYIPRGNANNP